ncbi:MAG: hypothetical protein HYY95_13690, partial [Candidatus Rokubacteria bacterium]|nr:hypothetical protein [Candidatus Rokubacteria bacterium]
MPPSSPWAATAGSRCTRRRAASGWRWPAPCWRRSRRGSPWSAGCTGRSSASPPSRPSSPPSACSSGSRSSIASSRDPSPTPSPCRSGSPRSAGGRSSSRRLSSWSWRSPPDSCSRSGSCSRARRWGWRCAPRAASQDQEMAAACGMRVRGVVMANFAIGSALAGAAGMLVGIYHNSVSPTMGDVAGYKGLAIIVLGGPGPEEMAAIAALITGLRAEGLGIILVEHQMRVAMSIVERVVVLDHGVLIAEGTPEAIRRDRRV